MTDLATPPPTVATGATAPASPAEVAPHAARPPAALPLEQQVLAGLHAVRPLIVGPIPAPVDELQRSAMAGGAVEWQPRSRADRRM